MPSPFEAAADVVNSRAKMTWKAAAAAAAKYGFNAIVCCVVAWLVWGAFITQIAERNAELKANNEFIREQLIGMNNKQTEVITKMATQLEMTGLAMQTNSEQLKQSSEVMRATQKCLEECMALYRELIRLMEKVSTRLESSPP